MKLTVLSGAGMSAESGIATFRDALTGLWSHYDPADLACEAGFRRDPALVWGWYRWRAAQLRRCRPNAGHLGLAALQGDHDVCIVTQNVDDLHERAGSRDVIHLHGELLHSRCMDGGHTQTPDPITVTAAPDEAHTEGRREPPPTCASCGAPFRPGVVWFGETLPQQAWHAAIAAVESAEWLVVIGTSGLVQPAASLPLIAKRSGARIIEINPSTTPITAHADLHWPTGAGEGVARLQAALAMS